MHSVMANLNLGQDVADTRERKSSHSGQILQPSTASCRNESLRFSY